MFFVLYDFVWSFDIWRHWRQIAAVKWEEVVLLTSCLTLQMEFKAFEDTFRIKDLIFPFHGRDLMRPAERQSKFKLYVIIIIIMIRSIILTFLSLYF